MQKQCSRTPHSPALFNPVSPVEDPEFMVETGRRSSHEDFSDIFTAGSYSVAEREGFEPSMEV